MHTLIAKTCYTLFLLPMCCRDPNKSFIFSPKCLYGPSRPLSWKKEKKSKQLLAAFTKHILSKHTLCLSIAVPLNDGSKWKSVTISCCKSGIQGSKDILYDEPKEQNMEPPVTFEPNGTIAGSVAVHNLFKSWLTMLRMPLPDQVTEGTLAEGPFLKIVETEPKIQNSGRVDLLKMVCNFLGSNATIKIPAMIFISMYLVVNIKYGVEVAKELTPLWIGGPLVMALYITMVKLIISLYIFSFKQSVKVLKKSPMAYDYVICGKLNEIIRVRLLTPVVNFWNLGYIEMSKRIRKDFELWLVDKYLDYVESIWPSYCKLIRFLKRANFI